MEPIPKPLALGQRAKQGFSLGLAEAAQSFNGFDLQVVSRGLGSFLFHDAHQSRSDAMVARHSQFVYNFRQDGRAEEIINLFQQFAPLRGQTVGQLPYHEIMRHRIPVAQSSGKEFFQHTGSQPAEQCHLGGSFRRRARLQNPAQMLDRLRAYCTHHFQHPFPFIPAGATLDTARDLIDRGVRHPAQHFRQAFGKMRFTQRFINESR